MVNLVDYFKENIKNDDYYYRFYDNLITEPEKFEKELEKLDWIEDTEKYKNNIAFSIYDIEDAITKFKELCDPKFDNSSNDIDKKCFYFLAYYLKSNGYYIKEFPHILERPPLDILQFTYYAIRNRAFDLKMDDDGTIKYQTRRKIVSDFHFMKKNNNIEINEDINILFEKISTRNAKYEDMSSDEKLQSICNLIENMLKKDDSYEILDYSKIGFDYINNDIITKYRKQIQCFRHASEESLKERKQFTEEQKSFLIDYGIIIIKIIHILKY